MPQMDLVGVPSAAEIPAKTPVPALTCRIPHDPTAICLSFSWPDGGTTPFRGEKNTNWEGGYRVPAMIRWPGLVPPRTEINDIVSAEDWTTTLVAAAGEPEIKTKLLQG